MTRLRDVIAEWGHALDTRTTVPCNLCGAALPFDDTARPARIAHYATCEQTSPLMRRAAVLIAQNHAQLIAEEV